MKIDLYLCRYGISVDLDNIMIKGLIGITDIPKKYRVKTRKTALMSFNAPKEKVFVEDGWLRVEE